VSLREGFRSKVKKKEIPTRTQTNTQQELMFGRTTAKGETTKYEQKRGRTTVRKKEDNKKGIQTD